MSLFSSLLIAGAIAFCAEHPPEPRGTDAPIAPAALTPAHRTTLAEIAPAIRLGARYRSEGLDDTWRPGRSGDCEDALLWAAQELRSRHPELAYAYRFVLVHQGWERRGTARVRLTRLVLVLESTIGERIVLDTQYRRPRPWSFYSSSPAWTARNGMGRAWTPY